MFKFIAQSVESEVRGMFFILYIEEKLLNYIWENMDIQIQAKFTKSKSKEKISKAICAKEKHTTLKVRHNMNVHGLTDDDRDDLQSILFKRMK